MDTVQHMMAIRKLEGLAEQYGTDVFGDNQISLLVGEIPELAEYKDIFRQFAENGLYEEVLEKLDESELSRMDVLLMAAELDESDSYQFETWSWVCQSIWLVVKCRSTGRSAIPSLPQSEHTTQTKRVGKVSRKPKPMRVGNAVVCVARILLGVLLLTVMAYFLGGFSLLTQLPDIIWRLFPEQMKVFLQDAPQLSSLWLPDGSYIQISFWEYAKQVLLRGLYTGVILGIVIWCVHMMAGSVEAARKRTSLGKQVENEFFELLAYLLCLVTVMTGFYVFLLLM